MANTLEPYRLTVHDAHDLLRGGELTSVELTESMLSRIRDLDDRLHSYIRLTEDLAIEQARAADGRLRSGRDVRPLTGIPVAVKDVFCVEGTVTTAGSKILSGFRAPYESTVTARLREAGAVFMGKANMDEFAMGSSTENSRFGPTANPWDPSRTPGGSSGGSSAAVAADLCLASVGTDTGGSIRLPAAFCGIVGLKPTYGRVSRYGIIAYASSLDQAGPMTKDVADAALLLQAVAGRDPADSTSADVPVPEYAAALTGDVSGMRLGVPREYFGEGLDPEVAEAVRESLALLEDMGAEVVEVSLPHTDYALAAYYLLAPAEASSNLARYDGMRYGLREQDTGELAEVYKATRSEGFGPEVKRRIMLGTFALSAGYYEAYYRKAQQVRTLIREDFSRAFERCDLVLGPTAPTAAFELGEKIHDPLRMYLSDVHTIPVNLAGLPGVSIPCGFSSGGLPIGLQMIGGPFREEDLLRAAHAFESNTDHHLRRPGD